MIDLKNKIIFIHIPKCAGTSVEQYFLNIRNLEHKNRSALSIFKNKPQSDLEIWNQHCTLDMIETYFWGGQIPEDFRIFTIVRNPYKRFWSEWAYRKIPSPRRKIGYYPTVNQLISMGTGNSNLSIMKDVQSHLQPQSKFLISQAEGRVKILKFENLTEEFNLLKQEWDLPSLPLPHENSQKRTKTPSARDLIKGKAFIESYYAADFQKFGYDVHST